MKNFQSIGGRKPFADLKLAGGKVVTKPAQSAVASPPAPQKPYGDPVHSKDRNGVYVRRGDRVKNHGEGGVTFLVVQVYTDFVIGLGDTVRKFGNNIDPQGWLDVFLPIDCCDCEIIGHVPDVDAEMRRIANLARANPLTGRNQ